MSDNLCFAVLRLGLAHELKSRNWIVACEYICLLSYLLHGSESFWDANWFCN